MGQITLGGLSPLVSNEWEEGVVVEQRLADLNLKSIFPAKGFFPSPIAWEDQVFYFLMLDRFSNGSENGYKDTQGNLVRSGTNPPVQPR